MTRDNNDTRKKVNAILFAAIMVISMVAIGFAGFAGSAAADAENLTADATVQPGEDLSFSGEANDSVDVQVWIDTNDTGVYDDGEPTVEVTTDSGGDFSGDIGVPSDLDEGEYQLHAFENETLSDGDAPETSTTFEVDDSEPDVRKTTHYVDSDEGAIIEVAFDETMDHDVSSAEAVISFTDDSDEVTIDDDTKFDFSGDGRLAINTSAEVYNRIDTVELSGVTDAAGNEFDDELDVRFAPETVDTTDDGAEFDAYSGSLVALEGDVGDRFRITGEDINRIRGTGDNSQVFILNTDGLSTGEYNITNQRSDDVTTLNLDDLGLGVSADADEFTTEEDVTATVTSEDIDREVDVALLDDDGDVVEEETGTIDSEGELNVNFGEQDTGTYSVAATDVDTGVTADSDDFEVVEAPEGDVDFVEQIVSENQGDNAEIGLTFEGGVEEVDLRIGDADSVGYEANISVNADGAEEVTVHFNTYAAGNDTFGADDRYVWVTTEDDDADPSIESFSQTTDIDGILDQGDYELSIATAQDGDSGAERIANDDPDEVGDLIIEDRSTDALDLWASPDADYDDLDDLGEAVEEGTLTQTEQVTDADSLVLDVSATGLGGLLHAQDEEDMTEALVSAFEDDAVDMRIRQRDRPTNQQRDRVDFTDADTQDALSVLHDEDEGHLYIVIEDVADLEWTQDRGFEDGDAYEVRFQVTDERLLDPDEGEDVEDLYETVENEVTYEDAENTWGADQFEVEADEDQELYGSTNVAPGHEFNIRVRSKSGVSPGFIMNQDATVDSDRTYVAMFDFSEASEDDEFWVRTQTGAPFGSTETEGIVVDSIEEDTPTPTPTPDEDDETPTPTPTPDEDDDETPTPTPDQDDDTPTPDEDDDDEPTEDDTPGFGAVVALIALIAAALLATRRRP